MSNDTRKLKDHTRVQLGEGYGRARVGRIELDVTLDLGEGPSHMTAAQARRLATLLEAYANSAEAYRETTTNESGE